MKYVWIVEMLNPNNKKWEPTVGCAFTRRAAMRVLQEWRRDNRWDTFRAVRYWRKG